MNSAQSLTQSLSSSLVGGALIGLSASLLLAATGYVAGVSGLLDRATRVSQWLSAPAQRWPTRVGAYFISGLLAAGLLVAAIAPAPSASTLDQLDQLDPQGHRGLFALIVAGLLVGCGTQLGSGCTSGHGVCGLSRLSKRSLVATLTFMATGAATVAVMRHFGVLS
jgi:uncharacterized membrane protein YedE/YeeE